jgi:deoxyribodipyrimidine photo-lyase
MLKVFWFRKDLRLSDNRALAEFINSTGTEDSFLFLYLKSNNSFSYYGEKRIVFLYECLTELQNDLASNNYLLNIQCGTYVSVFKKLIKKFGKLDVYAGGQVEPYCISRDNKIKKLLEENSGRLILIEDTNLVSFNESVKDDGTPYTVFTPFKNKFLKILNPAHYSECKVNLSKLNREKEIRFDDNYEFGNEYKKPDKSNFIKGGRSNAVVLLNDFIKSKIKNYAVNRDFPAIDGTSLLSAHLHFGTISIRECFRAYFKTEKNGKATDDIYKWRDELIWREFYYSITYHFPHIIDSAFKKDYDKVKWNYNKKAFKLWCEGKTGFPIVDAGMRQLNSEGWMHNRVRMIVAMFLTKDLLIDWRWGEKYFAEKLIDLDFSSNNGGWQWSASTGCDAQPYFRIFNPYRQSEKFDPEGKYIKKYVDELKNIPLKYIHNPSGMSPIEQESCGVIIGKDYPLPVVNHSEVSKIAIETFKNIKQKI